MFIVMWFWMDKGFDGICYYFELVDIFGIWLVWMVYDVILEVFGECIDVDIGLIIFCKLCDVVGVFYWI